MSAWSILCPGKSLGKAKIKPTGNHTIAVNGAIVQKHGAKYWCMTDCQVFKTVINEAPAALSPLSLPTLLVPERWRLLMANQDHETRQAFEKHGWLLIPTSTDKRFDQRLPEWARTSNSGISWRSCSLFIALAFAISKGASRITVYGADFKGTGYYQDGLENELTDHNEERWAQEARAFEFITEAAAAAGVTIEREGHSGGRKESKRGKTGQGNGRGKRTAAGKTDSAALADEAVGDPEQGEQADKD